MDDKNLEEVNKIDLDFKGGDDDDDSFGNISETKIKPIAAKQGDEVVEAVESENRAPVHTGVLIKFDDDEEDFNANMRKHSSVESIEEPKNIVAPNGDAKSYNEIDMECNYGDDTEEGYIPEPLTKKKSMFDDEEENLESKELALEEDATTLLPTHKVTVETIEDDFWKEMSKKYDQISEKALEEEINQIDEKKQPNLKNILKDLQKKHSKSNVKGAMGMSFHFAGNPAKEREMFNAGIGKQNDIFPKANVEVASGSLIGGESGTVGGGIEGVAAASSEGAVTSGDGASAGGEGAAGGGGESLTTKNYGKMLKEVFDTIGFDVVKNSDGTLVAKDAFNDTNKISAKNLSDLIYALQPFIESCIIIPLSLSTKQNFNSYQDWCNWYKDENKIKFPNQAAEIKYCDLLANHINDCEI